MIDLLTVSNVLQLVSFAFMGYSVQGDYARFLPLGRPAQNHDHRNPWVVAAALGRR